MAAPAASDATPLSSTAHSVLNQFIAVRDVRERYTSVVESYTLCVRDLPGPAQVD